jgi:hypothetical protein
MIASRLSPPALRPVIAGRLGRLGGSAAGPASADAPTDRAAAGAVWRALLSAGGVMALRNEYSFRGTCATTFSEYFDNYLEQL